MTLPVSGLRLTPPFPQSRSGPVQRQRLLAIRARAPGRARPSLQGTLDRRTTEYMEDKTHRTEVPAKEKNRTGTGAIGQAFDPGRASLRFRPDETRARGMCVSQSACGWVGRCISGGRREEWLGG